jgi:hypothetical protein
MERISGSQCFGANEYDKRIKKIEANIPKSEKPWLRTDCEGRIVKG